MITATASHTVYFSRKGETGARGAVLRGPQLWSDCPLGYLFQSGKEGEQWQDVVVHNDQYYVCKASHEKIATTTEPGSPTADKRGLWQLGDKIDLVASKILLSEYAVIDNLGASAIEMKDEAGNIVFEAKDGEVTCEKGTFNDVDVQTGKIAGFRISGSMLVNDDYNLDACVYIRNSAENVVATIGSNVLPAVTGSRAMARFENGEENTYGTNYGVLVSAKNADKNIALMLDGGCISGQAMSNKVISGTSAVYLARGINSIVAIGTGNVPIYLPQLRECDDGYVMRVQSLKDSGAMRIYTQNCETRYGTGRAAIICYVDGKYTTVTTGYFDLSAPGYAMELVYFRDLDVTVSGTTYHGAWLQYKMPRDW